ncbi:MULTISPECIES: hypothetical protein [Dyella]|uniref:Uncharacterized protein n=2 Tax=Dyella TaxID=231454 RepID=A0A4R0YZN6_9GAMM|nr:MULTISPECIES: hypothetical protein [Dyella]TBR39594.1 hypothetical protein EYV96_05165 [Dyella terrae]TCI12824.1 hypothetical protein EZM97_05705 [Dyella soli]
MTDSCEHWAIGDGSHVINKEATIETLLNDSIEWLMHAWIIAEDAQHNASDNSLEEAAMLRCRLSNLFIFVRMTLQCVREARGKMDDEELQRRICCPCEG